MRTRFQIAILVAASLVAGPVAAQTALVAPSNGVPLSFGMSPDQASQSLGVPLNYVRGQPGNELFAAIPNVRGSALSSRSDALYLQFRRGHLTGWKGDWGTIRP